MTKKHDPDDRYRAKIHNAKCPKVESDVIEPHISEQEKSETDQIINRMLQAEARAREAEESLVLALGLIRNYERLLNINSD